MTENGLTELSLGTWNLSPDGRDYYIWLSAKPTKQRVPDEIYGVRVEFPVEEWDSLQSPKQRLDYLAAYLTNALNTLEMYRLHPPPFKSPFTGAEVREQRVD